ncbi:MAG: 4Fe-4S dicluster domain-containing protein [Desulfobacteraceae bacterium]|nr:4Fe-4S dicluster domain-containing protein [Desulfobacteraceae bacterium]
MKWSAQAETAIKNVPFFIRTKVRKKVEAHAQNRGKNGVDIGDVTSLKKEFLSREGMEKEVKGYDISACFGGKGCPNTTNSCAELVVEIQALMEKADILSFLKANVRGGVKFHHEFRVCLSDCPNACSRPQIVDIGIIGAVRPGRGEQGCTLCSACVDTCPDGAICLDQIEEQPIIDQALCLLCGKCITACPTGTIQEKERGFRVLLGGRLGRHPRLAMEVPGIQSSPQVLAIVENCLNFYKTHSKNGQRFSKILTSVDQVLP